jgi:hypothetical protein
VLRELAGSYLRLSFFARGRASPLLAADRYATVTFSCASSYVVTQLGVEREMKICHNQPHLVPPMKLVFYDDFPPTPQPPPPSHLSQLVAQGKNLASRASSISIRKRPSLRPSISGPMPIQSGDDLPFRRRHQYRPLELSIYMPNNRLSDLPDFESADFDAVGEIQLPAKALLRSKSEEHLRHSPGPVSPVNQTTSMVGERQLDYWQSRRCSSIISTSRPPSAHDTFHSHPVVWKALPGIPAQAHHRQTDQGIGVTVLSPMQEEFTPVETPNMDHMFEFAQAEEDTHVQTAPSETELVPSEIQPPFKLSKPPTSQSYRTRSRSHSHTSSLSRNRVSQWLSRSESTTTSTSPPSSHTPEIKPTQFYQCAATPPKHSHYHSHTQSASTIATSILSGAESANSLTTMTTAPTIQSLRSRSTTVKSFGKKVVVEEELPPYFGNGNVSPPEAVTFKAPTIGLAF